MQDRVRFITDEPQTMTVKDGRWLKVGLQVQIDNQHYLVVQQKADDEFLLARITPIVEVSE